MAKPTTSSFAQFRIEIGDGETPEVFTKICGLQSKSFGIVNNTNSQAVGDCDDEDAPAFEEENIISQSMPLSGNGVFAREDQSRLLVWADDGEVHNIRVYPGRSIATDVEYWQGPAILKEITLTGERGGLMQSNMAFGWQAKPARTMKAA